MSSFTEPISPELALVSPELAAIARAGLPDRPWEAFLPPPAPAGDPVGDPVGDLVGDEALRLRPPATAQRPSPPLEPVADPLPGTARRRSRRPRVPVGLLLLAAFAGLVVAGSVLPVRDAPTLGPPPARANGLTAPAPGPVASTTPQVPPTVARAVTQAETVPSVPPPQSTPDRKNTRLGPLPNPVGVSRPRVRPQGGYVFAKGLGFLRVDARARTIVELRSSVGCGKQLSVYGIRIGADGRFSARRRAQGRDPLTVTVHGVFVGVAKVRGTIRVTRGRCDSGPVRFAGRLS